jgi:hypothetical protein
MRGLQMREIRTGWLNGLAKQVTWDDYVYSLYLPLLSVSKNSNFIPDDPMTLL